MRVPLHLPRPKADYGFIVAMAQLSPKGFRTVGKKAGVTKPKRRNVITRIALRV